jgi:hypothetical protein
MKFVVVLVAAAACSLAQAQTSPKKYPWDQRPNKCFMPGAEPTAECKVSDWPTFPQTRRHVDRLLGEPDWDLVARAEHEVGFSRERFATGEYRFEAWFLSLDSFFRAWGERGKALASDWVKARGNEGYAPLAMSMALRDEGWRARGSGYANTVTPEAWKIFHAKLDEADASLERASPSLREMAPWYQQKLRLAFERHGAHNPPIALLKQGTESWPDYLPLYTASMSYLTPKWGGSFEQMDAVPRFAMERTRARGKAAMYALVYERHLRVNPDSTYTLRDTRVDWALMKQGFRELEGDAPWMLNAFAGLACQMRDRDEARRLFQLYDERTSGSATTSADPCRTFAMSSQ